MEAVIAVWITAPDMPTAKSLANTLAGEKLAACISMFPVRSIYRWEGKIEDQGEVMMLAKTTEGRLDDIVKRVKELHPYDVPEILAVPGLDGNTEYIEWVRESTRA